MSAGAYATHVLVVDDDRATLGLFRDLLLDAGYTVTLLDYPPDDVADVARVHPGLIVLDLVFNGEERGWTFLQTVRQHPATSTIPVLVCTAAAQLLEERRTELDALSCGTDLKPFDIDRLLAALDVCLEDPDQGQATG